MQDWPEILNEEWGKVITRKSLSGKYLWPSAKGKIFGSYLHNTRRGDYKRSHNPPISTDGNALLSDIPFAAIVTKDFRPR